VSFWSYILMLLLLLLLLFLGVCWLQTRTCSEKVTALHGSC
jgi:hypothetical protein